MSDTRATALTPSNEHWPRFLSERLGENAPRILQVIGPLTILAARRTALFCSIRAPGDAIIRALDAARIMRDAGVTVISGFQSPVEKECLRILLRGKQPIIICPARAIEALRISSECRTAFDAGRLLFLSPFTKLPKRVTKDSASHRNKVVAALADDAYVAHVTPGGQTTHTAIMLRQWHIPLTSNAGGDMKVNMRGNPEPSPLEPN